MREHNPPRRKWQGLTPERLQGLRSIRAARRIALEPPARASTALTLVIADNIFHQRQRAIEDAVQNRSPFFLD